MAIRPVDLQLAYMAAPANAAVLSSAEAAPAAAQQAAAAAFAAEVAQREEQIEQPDSVHGSRVNAREERDPAEERGSGQKRRRMPYEEPAESTGPLGLAGEGEHFIDVTA